MKRSLFSIVFLLFAAAVSAQEINVHSEHGAEIDFSAFKTFDWADQVDNQLDSGVYFLNDLIFKAQIREAVRNEMMALGYEHSDNDADLVVNFRVFDKATKINGLQDYGSDYWAGANYRDISEDASFEVEPGTILISLINRETGSILWHGFASGLIDNDKFIKDEGSVIQAVNMIFMDFSQNSGLSRR